MAVPTLEFPEYFDELVAWEVEAKGVFEDARVRTGETSVSVAFFDPTRLAQEVEAQTAAGRAFLVKRLLVVPKLTVRNMRDAVADAPAAFFERA